MNWSYISNNKGRATKKQQKIKQEQNYTEYKWHEQHRQIGRGNEGKIQGENKTGELIWVGESENHKL